MSNEEYYVYMLRCKDNSIYTGIAKDLERRINEHLTKDKKCAKYTKNHEAVKLEISFIAKSKKDACSLEYNIKRLSKKEKEEIILKRKILAKLEDKVNIQNFKLNY